EPDCSWSLRLHPLIRGGKTARRAPKPLRRCPVGATCGAAARPKQRPRHGTCPNAVGAQVPPPVADRRRHRPGVGSRDDGDRASRVDGALEAAMRRLSLPLSLFASLSTSLAVAASAAMFAACSGGSASDQHVATACTGSARNAVCLDGCSLSCRGATCDVTDI